MNRKRKAGLQTESQTALVGEAQPGALSDWTRSLDPGQLAALRTFFSILDEWDKEGTRNVNRNQD
jgi:hypothetical protein